MLTSDLPMPHISFKGHYVVSDNKKRFSHGSGSAVILFKDPAQHTFYIVMVPGFLITSYIIKNYALKIKIVSNYSNFRRIWQRVI